MYYFQICFLLRESMFLNSVLINAEVWTAVSDQQINILHKSDVSLLLKFYGVPRSTAQELLYLEGGKAPIKFAISKRRLMYLFHILTRKNTEIIFKAYHAMILRPVKNDWYSMIQHEKLIYNIYLSDEEISKMSKKQFKKIVYEQVDKFALNVLLERGANHSKSRSIINSMNKSNFRTQPYLLCDELTRQEAQLCFALRSRSLDLKNNYKSKYRDELNCRTCKTGDLEEESHLLVCSGLQVEEDFSKEDYTDIFSSNIQDQIRITKAFAKILRKRDIILQLVIEPSHDDGPPAPN